jgi:adenosylmethionine-8-amino-7-oxononanoate aminotransferase
VSYQHPTGHVFYRKMAHARPMIDRGEGVYLIDENGKRYIDASGGPLVVNVGHGREEIVEAMRAQAAAAAYVHANMFTSAPLEQYCEALAPIVPIDRPRFFLLSSGSEVIEASIKLARQLQQARGHPERTVVISRRQSYHGMTLGALSASGRPGLRAPYTSMMVSGAHVDPPYPYRDPRPGKAMAALVEEQILTIGPERVAAFLAEPISGASLGAAAPDDDYWPAVRDICDRHGVLLIADEVLVGLGRTGRWWAIERWGVRPDLLVASKGTAGGYFPMGFVAAAHDDVELLRTTLGDFNHGGTFSHHAVGAAAGLATLEILQRERLVEAARERGALLGQRLEARLRAHPHVGDVRGEGMFWGVELVEDRATKAPFEAARHVAAAVHEAAFDRGVIVYYSQGCADGVRGDLAMVGPPFIIDEAQIDTVVDTLADAIDAVCGR